MFLSNTIATKRTYLLNVFSMMGKIESTGQSYDFTEVWLLCPHRNSDREKTTGLGLEKLRWGGSENAKKLAHISLISTGPIEVEVDVEQVQSGKGEKEKMVSVIHDLRIVQPPEVEAQKSRKVA